ncbi:hypothetical protein FK529_18955 [Tsukamurella asaccharolytica]|uniref:Uncharacterized protein n=1 Tax=Tsukamurella asaccharolytica TaxID=2592067 RepID=A0A5C5R5Y8_9ACTN|nr:hypothetical protein [Tsukamurella asaccharolytica]TWS17774.1 hypothetical protein FK529_18955 [Tsukamurella asaccharolytica]
MDPRDVVHEIRERVTSGVERAREIVRDVAATVRERLPGATEREVAQTSGDFFVHATEHDVAEAGGDAALSPAVREQVVEADVLPAELAGLEEQRLGVPLEDNAIRQLEARGHGELVTAGVEALAAEDPEAAADVATLADEAAALTTLDKTDREHEDETAPGELLRRTTEYERQFRHQLAGMFGELLAGGLTDAEQQFIANNAELQHMIEAARASFAGEPVAAVEYVGSPEVMRQCALLVEAAHRVDGEYQARMAAVGERLGVAYSPGGVKSIGRMAEKTERENGGDVSRIKDVVRGRLIIPGDLRDDGQYIAAVRDAGFSIMRDRTTGEELIKRNYIAENGTPLPVRGQPKYLDTKITIKLTDKASGNEVSAEMVIATPEMAAATVAEHPLYEIRRSLNGTSAAEIRLKKKLRAVSANFYRSVSDRVAESVEKGGV